MRRSLLFAAAMVIGVAVFAQTGFNQLKNPRLLETAETSMSPVALEEYVEPMEFTPITNMVQVPTVKNGRNIE